MTREEAGVLSIWWKQGSRSSVQILLPETCCLKPSLLSAGQIDAEEDHDSAGDLIDPQRLSEEHDARCDPDDGDEVLVDEHPVRPNAAYPPLPRRERKSGGEDSRVGDCGPGSGSHTPPLQAQKLWRGNQQQERDPEQYRIGSDRERRMAL